MTAVTLEGPPSLCLPSFLRCRANAEVSIGTPLENPLWATLPSSPTGVHPTIRFAASALQRFVYMTGQRRRAFRNARLAGSWNSWADIPMAEIVAEDGCLAFAATVSFDDGQAGQRVWWGVRLDGPAGANAWGIMTDDQQRQQELQLPGPGASAEAHYYLTWSRRLGAQKHYPGGSAAPDLRLGAERPERGGFVRDRRRLYRRRRRWEGPQSAGCVAAADDRRHLGKRSGSGLRRKRGRAIYVPDQERPGPNHLPHRHLLALANWAGSVDPREDLAGERAGVGARMFRFYQDLIRMRRVNRALRSRQIDIVHASNSNRVIAFTRRDG